MKIAIVIARDQYVRNLVTAGSFDELAAHELIVVLGERGVRNPAPVEERFERVVTLPEEPRRMRPYNRLQLLLLASYRSRSRTMDHKVELLPRLQRWRWKLSSLPGLRPLLKSYYLWRAGRNEALHALLGRERPDLLIAPSGGIDVLVNDAVISARQLGIRSLVLVHNWDNLSSKGAFAVPPDALGVWGPQSVEQAQRIHRIPARTVHTLGAPSLDHYFRHVPGSTTPRFPFRYALFAGCYAPFDELTPLQELERVIEERGLDLKVVYRPHPHRRGRIVPDHFDEAGFRHVVMDPEVADLYERSFEGFRGDPDRKPVFPGLDSYPATFEHAEFVVCPLSTMIVEAAIFEKRVIVVAYDDGVHPNSPAQVVHYDHFSGIDRIDGFVLTRRREDLAEHFAELALGGREPEQPLREQIGDWLHHDDRTYAQRLAALVEELGAAPCAPFEEATAA